MLPLLKPGQVILVARARRFKPGCVVVARRDGVELIKRIHEMDDVVTHLRGDNAADSHDVTVSHGNVVGRVIWPLRVGRS